MSFMGIVICGLNGAGKSTLGKTLAEKMDFHFIDIENLYFPKTNPDYVYASPRTREDVAERLLSEIQTHKNFILASVKGDYGEDLYSFFQYAILIEVPRDIRLQRVKERSFQKFGSRMLSGGDLFEQEEKFFRIVESRNEDTVEEWVKSLKCPVIRIDGTKPIDENADFIAELIQNKNSLYKQAQ
jgi:thymidylate kinase